VIYLDHNATTFIDPLVYAHLVAALQEPLGNPSSIHRYGQIAKGKLIAAKKSVAKFFGVETTEIYFPAGATEGLNMLINSIPKKSHVISSSLEHLAVLEPLRRSHCSVTYLNPKKGEGAISVDQVRAALRPETRACVFTAANNETGVKTDLEGLAHLAQERGIDLIIDGVAWLGKEPLHIPQGVSAICFSGHKIHGPQGIGICLMRKHFSWSPYIVGGVQQQGMRGGTENLPAILGVAKALERLDEELPQAREHMRFLRDRFETGLLSYFADLIIHGGAEPRICNTSSIAFPGVDGETLLFQLDLSGVAASHGSACSAGTLTLSHVLIGMGIAKELAASSLRFSLSRMTTQEEIDRAIEIVASLVRKLR
jgi:cysteine desulfurase